jgi:hypothetical protein
MRKINKNVSRKAAAVTVATALTVFGGAGAAIAYWTTTGSGSGSASVQAAAGNVTLSADAISGLAPGSAAVIKDISALNNTDTILAVNAVSVTVTGSSPLDSDLTSAELAGLGVHATVVDNAANAAAHGSTVVGTVKVEIDNQDDNNQDALKGASLVLHFTSN